ncbi:hypothetical protein NC653_035372 [Populus alba x Populus x berolinensis]|uniref:TF-B3 domain-containing protein n=1 Tax=Populus alba x Populus x berolinensis TaxID=444605 RepID=A0AAD6LPS4_9ROSI|nr:hypothetical protein NC653_035372 [Populus alba x Populus x berolinensis]
MNGKIITSKTSELENQQIRIGDMSDSQNSTLATFHGDDKMEQDSGSMGLIGEVVGFDDRIQEEQMHTGNTEHSLNRIDPVNHGREPRPNIGNVFNCEPRPNRQHAIESRIAPSAPKDTTAEPSTKEPLTKEPSTKVISKSLSRTDIEERLSVPASFLHFFPKHEGAREIEFQAIDTLGKLWTFKLSCRSEGHPKPVITGQWLSFVKDKGVKVGDTVTISHQSEGQYSISVSRKLFNVLATLPA